MHNIQLNLDEACFVDQKKNKIKKYPFLKDIEAVS